jgi:hypothetical protein
LAKKLLSPVTVQGSANAVTLAGSAAAAAVTLTASGTDTNVSVNVAPKGAGTFQVGGVAVPLGSSAIAAAVAIAASETVVVAYSAIANELVAGTTFEFVAYYTQSGTNAATPTVRIRVGGTTLIGNIASTLTGPVGGTGTQGVIRGTATIRTAGAGGTVIGNLEFAKNAVSTIYSGTTGTVAVDTTAAMRVELTVASGNGSNTYTFNNATVTKIK